MNRSSWIPFKNCVSVNRKNRGSSVSDSSTYSNESKVQPMDKPNPSASPIQLCGVWQATFLIVAAVVGLGILALPRSIAQVGWIPGIGLLVALFFVNVYTGLILWRLKMTFPHATSYKHIGEVVWGPTGRAFCHLVTLTQLGMLEAEYFLVNTESVAVVLLEPPWCRPTWGILMAGALLPFVQIRTLTHVSFLSAISGLAVVLVLLLCVWEMWSVLSLRALTQPLIPFADIDTGGVQLAPPPATSPSTAISPSLLVIFNSMSTITFACGSQFVYLEVMSEMRNVAEFPKSMFRAGVFILVSYVLIAVAGFHTYGAEVPAYIVDIIAGGWTRWWAVALMLIHTMVSYILMSQILCSSLLEVIKVGLTNSASTAAFLPPQSGPVSKYHCKQHSSDPLLPTTTIATSATTSSALLPTSSSALHPQPQCSTTETSTSFSSSSSSSLLGAPKTSPQEGYAGGSQAPHAFSSPSHTSGKEEWFITSAAVLAGALAVSNTIPFFGELTVIIGSLIGGPISFALPATFLLSASSQGYILISKVERIALYILVIFSIVLILLGLSSGVVNLLDKWDTFGYPFACHCIGKLCETSVEPH